MKGDGRFKAIHRAYALIFSDWTETIVSSVHREALTLKCSILYCISWSRVATHHVRFFSLFEKKYCEVEGERDLREKQAEKEQSERILE